MRRSRLGVAAATLLALGVSVTCVQEAAAATAPTATTATAPTITPTITARANTRLRFTGSNVQCMVAANERAVAFDIDCFVDKGSQGQIGSHHAAIDGDNQLRIGRTTISGVGIPGGVTEWIWSNPEVQQGKIAYRESAVVAVRLGDVVRIGSTRLYCLYQVSDVIDTGAPAVACMYAADGAAGRTPSTDDLFRVPAGGSTRSARHAIFVSNRVAAAMALHDGGTTEVLFQRRHFA